jgi:cobalt/nickel transport system permease protein
MHIVDGVLSLPVLATGALLTTGGVALGLRCLEVEQIPRAAVLGACFFVASLVHVPIGPSSAHLMLIGLMGIVLGWTAFPVILVGLLLQAVFFGFGGLLVLGVNTFNLAFAAVGSAYLCSWGIRRGGVNSGFVWGAMAGAIGVLLSALLVGVSLALVGDEFIVVAKLTVVASLPVALVEGLLTGAAIALMRRVKPDMLQGPIQASAW